MQRAMLDNVHDVVAFGEGHGIGDACHLGGTISLARTQPQIARLKQRVAEFERFGFGADYGTPEQEIPEGASTSPFEVCMTLNRHWGYNQHDHDWKSAEMVIHNLCDIASKGGNYLLNVGPDGNGELPPEAVSRLREIGAWMRVNGEAIHGSRAIAPYRAGKFRYARANDGAVYAFYLPEANETKLPKSLRIPGPAPAAGAQVKLLGSDAALRWRRDGDVTVVEVPVATRNATANAYAWAIRLPGAAPAR